MKILFFARRFYPLIGGVEKHCLEIGKRLVERGDELTVVTEVNPNDQFSMTNFQFRENYNGIDIFRIPIKTSEKLKKFQIWKWLWENRQLIKEANIIHCHDVFYWYLPFRFFYPRKKVFTTFHGYEGSEPPKFNQILSHKIAKWLSWGTMAIGDWHEKWYGIKADKVSYGAVNDESNEPHKSHETYYDFAFIGRLAKDTGIMVYLEALKILNKEKNLNRFRHNGRNDILNMVVCGEGPQMEEAVKFVKKFKLNVEFKGFVSDVEKYIEKSNFIFVSRYLGILEALLCKKLIFAVYDSAIKRDYLQMAPFAKSIVIEKDALALAEKIRYFANRPEKSNEKIDSGFAWTEKQTWDKLTDLYIRLWQKARFR